MNIGRICPFNEPRRHVITLIGKGVFPLLGPLIAWKMKVHEYWKPRRHVITLIGKGEVNNIVNWSNFGNRLYLLLWFYFHRNQR